MWRFRDAELNCVRMKMRLTSECRHELIGMSIRRYLPAIGTAGFDRWWVSGKRRCPRPPPRMMASTSFMDDSLCKRRRRGQTDRLPQSEMKNENEEWKMKRRVV